MGPVLEGSAPDPTEFEPVVAYEKSRELLANDLLTSQGYTAIIDEVVAFALEAEMPDVDCTGTRPSAHSSYGISRK
jgi:hypothetical protein